MPDGCRLAGEAVMAALMAEFMASCIRWSTSAGRSQGVNCFVGDELVALSGADSAGVYARNAGVGGHVGVAAIPEACGSVGAGSSGWCDVGGDIGTGEGHSLDAFWFQGLSGTRTGTSLRPGVGAIWRGVTAG